MTLQRFKPQKLTRSILVVILIIAVSAIAYHLVPAVERRQREVAAVVDGEAITNTELRYWMLLNKAEVYSSFYRSHGAPYDDGFWTMKFDGKTPLEVLRRTSLDNAIRYKLKQKVAKELGIQTIMNFDELMRERERVNKNRRNRVEDGRPVYGPVNLTSRNYVEKVFDEMIQRTKYKLSETDFKISDTKMRRLYSQYKAEYKLSENSKKEVPVFEAFKAVRQMQYTEKKYDQLIDELIAKAELEIVNPVFEKVKL